MGSPARGRRRCRAFKRLYGGSGHYGKRRIVESKLGWKAYFYTLPKTVIGDQAEHTTEAKYPVYTEWRNQSDQPLGPLLRNARFICGRGSAKR